MRLSDIRAWWFRKGGDDSTPVNVVTGLLVSRGCVAPVFNEDIVGAFDGMYEYVGERMYDLAKVRPKEATHYRLTKGETVTRECTVRVSGE